MWATFAIILVVIVVLATERYSIPSVSLAAIVALLLLFGIVPPTGVEIPPGDLLRGFANPALVTVLALLVVGRALFNTDALEAPSRVLSEWGGSNVRNTIIVLLVPAAVVSAFMNNTPVVVMFIPIIVAVAAQRNFAASRALLPLSFICILGGMTTLIGSSTNLLVAGTAERYGIEIGFFEVTGPGVMLFAVGALYILFVMPRILNRRNDKDDKTGRSTGRQFVAQIEIRPGHRMIGESAVAGTFPTLEGVTVRSVQRDGEDVLPPFDDMALEVGDLIVVAATRSALTRALALGAASLPVLPDEDRKGRPTDDLAAPAESFTLAEAVVAPGSRYGGRTIEASRIRQTYGTMILGLQRRASMPRGPVREMRIEAGDTLLLGGLPEDYDRLRASRDLLLIERSAAEVPMRVYAPRAVAVFAVMILCASFGLVPIVVAALAAAYAMIALGCLSLRQAAASFDREIFMLVGASLALATAMERTGGAALVAQGVVDVFAQFGPSILMSALFLVTAFLTNILSNNATAVLFTPIAIGIAERLGLPAMPFIVCVILAANCSFATPVGYQTNLLVMGPGRYRFSDFVRTGVPLVILMWIAFSLIGPWYYGL